MCGWLNERPCSAFLSRLWVRYVISAAKRYMESDADVPVHSFHLLNSSNSIGGYYNSKFLSNDQTPASAPFWRSVRYSTPPQLYPPVFHGKVKIQRGISRYCKHNLRGYQASPKCIFSLLRTKKYTRLHVYFKIQFTAMGSEFALRTDIKLSSRWLYWYLEMPRIFISDLPLFLVLSHVRPTFLNSTVLRVVQ